MFGARLIRFFNTKLQEYTPSAKVCQRKKSEKNKTLLYLSDPGVNTDWMDRYQIEKAWACSGGLLPKILEKKICLRIEVVVKHI